MSLRCNLLEGLIQYVELTFLHAVKAASYAHLAEWYAVKNVQQRRLSAASEAALLGLISC